MSGLLLPFSRVRYATKFLNSWMNICKKIFLMKFHTDRKHFEIFIVTDIVVYLNDIKMFYGKYVTNSGDSQRSQQCYLKPLKRKWLWWYVSNAYDNCGQPIIKNYDRWHCELDGEYFSKRIATSSWTVGSAEHYSQIFEFHSYSIFNFMLFYKNIVFFSSNLLKKKLSKVSIFNEIIWACPILKFWQKLKGSNSQDQCSSSFPFQITLNSKQIIFVRILLWFRNRYVIHKINMIPMHSLIHMRMLLNGFIHKELRSIRNEQKEIFSEADAILIRK